MSDQVRLHYHRPPDRTDLFIQDLLHDDSDVLITYMAATPMKRPLVVDGEVALEDGSPVIWFTFPGLMHDIGRFHRADGTFTGLYSNIMEPVRLHSRLEWTATDLFVDVWLAVGCEPQLLDVDELENAASSNWVTAETATAAMNEANRLLECYDAGTWPPAVVNEWPLSRVRKSL